VHAMRPRKAEPTEMPFGGTTVCAEGTKLGLILDGSAHWRYTW